MSEQNLVNKILFGAVICLFLALLGSLWCGGNQSRSRKNWEHNYEVLQDSVEVIETKYGETLYENGSLILEKKELEEALNITKKQIKEYEKKLGSNLAYISNLEAQLKIKDTVTVTQVVHDTLSNSYLMNYKDEWLGFEEIFSLKSPSSPVLDVYNISMNVPLRVGLTDDYTIFVTSPNPYFNITSIEGAVIDGEKFAPKPKHWSFGVYGGFGVQYGLINKQLDAGPQGGFGIIYMF